MACIVSHGSGLAGVVSGRDRTTEIVARLNEVRNEMEDNIVELVPYDHIVFTEFDGGEGILVDLNAKKYFQMNPTATLVWRALAAGRAQEEIIREMISEYDVDTEHAKSSIERLLTNLQNFQLIGPRSIPD